MQWVIFLPALFAQENILAYRCIVHRSKSRTTLASTVIPCFSSNNSQLILPSLYMISPSLWSRRRYVKKEQTERPEAIVRALKR
jgi:hypothetical protein